MLEFSVSNQLLTRLDATQVYSDSENYLECAFQFSDDWAGLEAVATFGHGDVAEPISVRIVDGVCRVPHEVIHPYGFTLAVYGSGEPEGQTGYTHIPTNVVTVEVGEAGTAVGLSAPPPTPNLYDSLLDTLRAGEAAALAAQAAAETAAAQAAEEAGSAAEARTEACLSAGEAENARLEALESARSAMQSAALVQELSNSVTRNAGAVADARQEAADTLLLHKSYAMGTEEYAVIARLEDILWTDEGFEADYLGLRADRRYLAEVDGVRYDGIARLLPEETPEGGAGEGDGPVQLLDLWEEDDERPETPSGGEDGPIILPDLPTEPGRYLSRVALTVGPVTLTDCVFGQPENGKAGACFLTTEDGEVARITVMTDGHDNGRYYMEEARLARSGAAEEAAAAQAWANAAAGSAGTAETKAASAAASASEAVVARNAAEAARNRMPRIGANGNWWLWDTTQDTYRDSNKPSRGADGTDGKSPFIQDGTWWVWDGTAFVDSEVPAKGEIGAPGRDGKSPVIREGTWWTWDETWWTELPLPQNVWDTFMSALADAWLMDFTALETLVEENGIDYINDTLMLRRDPDGSRYETFADVKSDMTAKMKNLVFRPSGGNATNVAEFYENFNAGNQRRIKLTWWELQYAIIVTYPANPFHGVFPHDEEIKADTANFYPWRMIPGGGYVDTGVRAGLRIDRVCPDVQTMEGAEDASLGELAVIATGSTADPENGDLYLFDGTQWKPMGKLTAAGVPAGTE